MFASIKAEYPKNNYPIYISDNLTNNLESYLKNFDKKSVFIVSDSYFKNYLIEENIILKDIFFASTPPSRNMVRY